MIALNNKSRNRDLLPGVLKEMQEALEAAGDTQENDGAVKGEEAGPTGEAIGGDEDAGGGKGVEVDGPLADGRSAKAKGKQRMAVDALSGSSDMVPTKKRKVDDPAPEDVASGTFTRVSNIKATYYDFNSKRIASLEAS